MKVRDNGRRELPQAAVVPPPRSPPNPRRCPGREGRARGGMRPRLRSTLEHWVFEASANAKASATALERSEAASLARVMAHTVAKPSPMLARTAAFVSYLAWASLVEMLGLLSGIAGAPAWFALLYALGIMAAITLISFGALFRVNYSLEVEGTEERRLFSSLWFDQSGGVAAVIEFNRTIAIEMQLQGVYYPVKAAILSAVVGADIAARSVLLNASESSAVTLALVWMYPMLAAAAAPPIINGFHRSAACFFGKAQRVANAMPGGARIGLPVRHRITKKVVGQIAELQATQFAFLLALGYVMALEQTLVVASGTGNSRSQGDLASTYRQGQVPAHNLELQMWFSWGMWLVGGIGAVWLLRAQRLVLVSWGKRLVRIADAKEQQTLRVVGEEAVHAARAAVVAARVAVNRAGSVLDIAGSTDSHISRVTMSGLSEEAIVTAWMVSLHLAVSATFDANFDGGHTHEVVSRFCTALGCVAVFWGLASALGNAMQKHIAHLETFFQADEIGGLCFANRLLGYVNEGFEYVCAKLFWTALLLWRSSSENALAVRGRFITAVSVSLFAVLLHVVVLRDGSRKAAEKIIELHSATSSREAAQHTCPQSVVHVTDVALHMEAVHTPGAGGTGALQGHWFGGVCTSLADMAEEDIANVDQHARIWV